MGEEEASQYSYFFTEKNKEVPLLDFASNERAQVSVSHYFEKKHYGRTLEHCDWWTCTCCYIQDSISVYKQAISTWPTTSISCCKASNKLDKNFKISFRLWQNMFVELENLVALKYEVSLKSKEQKLSESCKNFYSLCPIFILGRCVWYLYQNVWCINIKFPEI